MLRPNRGPTVAPIDIDQVRDFFEMFDLCQRAATRWAALRRTDQDIPHFTALAGAFRDAVARRDSLGQSEANAAFHGAIAEACGNAHLRDTYKTLLGKGMRLSHLSLIEPLTGAELPDSYFAWLLDEHDRMVALIRARAPDPAEQVAHAHAEKFRANVLRYLALSEAPALGVPYPDEPKPPVRRAPRRLSGGS
ncbi:GntR family transcriptional regulator [Elioraea sp.]|uniref:GntR family transcriptional regulator n=1 Tax=Elioraea sp. TaxID=2185103 RepID=UPI003F6E89D4